MYSRHQELFMHMQDRPQVLQVRLVRRTFQVELWDAGICRIDGGLAVSRSLGDPDWKKTGHGSPVLSCIPEIQSQKLSWAERHAFLLLVSKPVAQAVDVQDLISMARVFPAQPRAACGEITAKAAHNLQSAADVAQCTAIEVWFLPGGNIAGDADDGAAGAGAEAAGGGVAAASFFLYSHSLTLLLNFTLEVRSAAFVAFVTRHGGWKFRQRSSDEFPQVLRSGSTLRCRDHFAGARG